jgi:hypothetical protein
VTIEENNETIEKNNDTIEKNNETIEESNETIEKNIETIEVLKEEEANPGPSDPVNLKGADEDEGDDGIETEEVNLINHSSISGHEESKIGANSSSDLPTESHENPSETSDPSGLIPTAPPPPPPPAPLLPLAPKIPLNQRLAALASNRRNPPPAPPPSESLS